MILFRDVEFAHAKHYEHKKEQTAGAWGWACTCTRRGFVRASVLWDRTCSRVRGSVNGGFECNGPVGVEKVPQQRLFICERTVAGLFCLRSTKEWPVGPVF
jgi:hypothetical protein